LLRAGLPQRLSQVEAVIANLDPGSRRLRLSPGSLRARPQEPGSGEVGGESHRRAWRSGCPKTLPPRCLQIADSIGVRFAGIAAHKQMILESCEPNSGPFAPEHHLRSR